MLNLRVVKRLKPDVSVPTYGMFKGARGSVPAAEGGPVYGELTENSMDRIVTALESSCSMGPDAVFADIGSGIGKPCIHAAIKTPVRYSLGVECMGVRWWQSVAMLARCLDNKEYASVATRVFFAHADIEDMKDLGETTHVYCFSKGFNPATLRAFCRVVNASDNVTHVACMHAKIILETTGMRPLTLVTVVDTRMSGSGEQQKCYVYRIKPKSSKRLRASPTLLELPGWPKESDACVKHHPSYMKGVESLMQGRDAYHAWIKGQLDAPEEFGRPIKRRRTNA